MLLKLIIKIYISFTLFSFLSSNTLYTQSLSSSRGIAIGAFTSVSDNISSIDWNPAGLINIKNWEVELSNYINTNRKISGMTLNTLGVGKKFLNNNAIAICYSPGKILEFIIPTTFTLRDTNGNTITTRFDKNISYTQNYSFGYAYHALDNISVGITGKYFESNLSDTKYFFGSNNDILSQVNNYSSNTWTFDIGGMYTPEDYLSFGLLLKNLFQTKTNNFDSEVREFQLMLDKLSIVSVQYRVSDDLKIAAEGDTKKNFRTGIEMRTFNTLDLRGSLYTADFPKSKFEAGAFGAGYTYEQIQIDVSYLKYFSQKYRAATVSLSAYKTASFSDIDYTPFTGDRFSISAKINLGTIRDMLTRIEYVEMLGEIFPASYQVYAFRPIGKARVRNITQRPINVKLSFFVNNLMDSPTETKPYTILPNELFEIPFYAVFNTTLINIKQTLVYDGTVYASAEPIEDYDDRYQTRVLIRGRNDWNGDVLLLKYFITPDDPDVIKFSRNALEAYKNTFDTLDNRMTKFKQAQIVFDRLSDRIQYIQDPKQSEDFVQYPAETLSLRSGDCDDLSVCYSALLSSIGISTAFVDVIPPDNPQNSHIYLLFDTEIEARDAAAISDNSKRFIIRKNNKGVETVWLPVETTESSKGFTEAWNLGSKEYFQDVIIDNGLGKGWIRIVDL
jgi:hypothetical protein